MYQCTKVAQLVFVFCANIDILVSFETAYLIGSFISVAYVYSCQDYTERCLSLWTDEQFNRSHVNAYFRTTNIRSFSFCY